MKAARALGVAAAALALMAGCERADYRPANSVPAEVQSPWQPEAPRPVGGKIAFDEEVHDFGQVRQGEFLTTEFTYRNAGDAPLKVDRVVASCGCTAVASTGGTLGPGGSGAIKATLRTKGMRGRVNKSITVYSNDASAPRTLLRLQATVVADVDVRPRFVNLGHVRAGASASGRVEVLLAPDRDVEIVEVESSSPHVTARIEREGDRRFLEVSLGGTAPVGGMNERVVLISTSKQDRSVSVAVQAVVQGPISVMPTSVSFGAIPTGEFRARTLHLQHFDGKPFAITSVAANHPLLNPELLPADRPGRYDVIVRSVPSHEPTQVRGEVRIRTDLAAQPEIVVPIFGVIAPPPGASQVAHSAP